MKIILASKSIRRKEILKLLNLEFEVIVSDIEEEIDKSLSIEDAIKDISFQKAKKVFDQYQDSVVIGCDTVVVIDNMIIGKPKDKQNAYNIFRKLSNKTHSVITALTIICGNKTFIDVSKSEVTFKDLSDEEINQYIITDEPYDKSGGYAILGYAARFVTHISGDVHSVMGLPISKVYDILKELNILV